MIQGTARYSHGMTFVEAVHWTSLVTKLVAAAIGFDAARRWRRPAAPGMDGVAAATLNGLAAYGIALSVIVGAASVLIHAIWTAPGVWGP